MTLSPFSADIGMGWTRAFGRISSKSSTMSSKTWRSKSTRSILLTASANSVIPSSCAIRAWRRVCDADAVARVHEQDRDVRRRRAGRHVARVLFVARRVGEDELAARRREIAVRDVDRDALLALGFEAVGEQREIDRPGGAVLRRLLDRADLILVDRSRVVQQSPDQRALPIVYAAGRADAEQPRHQK